MYFELCKWDFKPILMTVEYKCNNKYDFIKNFVALIQLVELENNIKLTLENIWDYINISEMENNLENQKLLDYLEIDSLKYLNRL